MNRHGIISLRVGVAIPFIHIGNIIVSSLFYPGYSQSRQFVSELGASDAPHPWLFNTGLALTGVAAIITAFGFLRAFQSLAANPIMAWLTSTAVALFGVSLLLGALFPLPDPRHGAYGLQKPILVGPLLFAATLWKCDKARLLKVLLLVINVALVATFLLIIGVGGLATRENGGIIQRIAILTVFPWLSIGAFFLLRHLASRTIRVSSVCNP
jgi:hypothetical membrane protein